MIPTIRKKIVEYAQKHINKPYDFTGATASFFCTELVGKAFESVGLSLSKNAPWLTVPGGYVDSDQLDVVKQLKP